LELTIESAFSTGGLVGHFSYLLLVASMLMRAMTPLRILVIASALVAITYDLIWLKDPIGVFWETLLVVINVIQIGREWYENHRSRFTPEEKSFFNDRLSSLSPREARRLLNLGVWVDGTVDTTLAIQGQAVPHLVYLTQGEVEIFVSERLVGHCHPGNFIGEMSVLGGTSASATARVSQPARYWVLATERLAKLRDTAPEIVNAIELGIAQDLRNKVESANRRTPADA